VETWDSQEVFDRFLDEVYLPAMQAADDPAPARREVFPAYHAGPVQR
jgi:hypothetical protein